MRPTNSKHMRSVVCAILAVCETSDPEKLGIGYQGKLPWPKIENDMAWFRTVTTSNTFEKEGSKNVVVMGRNTWESIPEQFRPLRNRENVVVTSKTPESLGLPAGVLTASSLDHAISLSKEQFPKARRIFIIGGAALYKEAIERDLCDELFLTKIFQKFECDTFFDCSLLQNCIENSRTNHDLYQTSSSQAIEENGIRFSFRYHRFRKSVFPMPDEEFEKHKSKRICVLRSSFQEDQYLDAIHELITSGEDRDDRTGVGTLGSFGYKKVYDLTNQQIPIFGTKKINMFNVFKEMRWILRGGMKSQELEVDNVNIWKFNTSRESLDKAGLPHYQVGEVGESYGYNLRHFGAEYKGCDANYEGEGFDQLKDVIRLVKESPTSRRIIWSLWNPATKHKAALPPCHLFAQFYVGKGQISCQMYQRSCDMGLGVPYNVASYALITILLAHSTGLKPGHLHHCMGDVHVYKNHVGALFGQCVSRNVKECPSITVKGDPKDIWDYDVDDIEIIDYDPDTFIQMKCN